MPQDIRLIKLSKSLGQIAGEGIKNAVMKGSAEIDSKTSQGKRPNGSKRQWNGWIHWWMKQKEKRSWGIAAAIPKGG